MATITGLTAERMLEIEAQSIVDGEIIGDNLILERFDGTPIDAGPVVGPPGPTGPTGPAGAAPLTGDYKISARTSDHTDSLGGNWYLCDGRASPHANLTALVGANLPDARGRMLAMLGTNAAVNVIGDNDGVATVANRRPQHRHTPHNHQADNGQSAGGSGSPVYNQDLDRDSLTAPTTFSDGGSGVATDSLDAPAFVVPGNLFIYLQA